MQYLKFDLFRYKVIGNYLPFILLLIYETCNYYASSYQPNSILFLREFLIVLCCVFLLDLLLSSNKKYQLYFVIFISLLPGILALFNIPSSFFGITNQRFTDSMIFPSSVFYISPWGFCPMNG